MFPSRYGAVVFVRLYGLFVVANAMVGRVQAHGGSLASAAGDAVSTPAWVVAAAGVAAVGASVLLAVLVTGRAGERAARKHRRQVRVPAGRAVRVAVRAAGVAALLFVLAVGVLGPVDPLSNAAVVVVWVGWWAGFAMSTYLVGNSWPLVNPWRTLSRALPRIGREYDWRHGAWPSVAGLLVLVWVEVVSPVADRPRALVAVVLAYSAVTVAGATVYGTGTWFGAVDPVARVFRCYGRVAPVTAGGSGRLVVRPPGAALSDSAPVDRSDEVAFVVALAWVTAYDGLITTPLWGTVATAAVRAGLPPAILYPLALFVGFGLLLGVYLLAARLARRIGGAAGADRLARRVAPSLLAVAVGSHLAHFLGYFLALTPTLVATVSAPFDAVTAPVYVLPDWIGAVAVAAVPAGYLLAAWTTHIAALDLFSDHDRALRGQSPFLAVLLCYTIGTLWIVTRPAAAPPFL